MDPTIASAGSVSPSRLTRRAFLGYAAAGALAASAPGVALADTPLPPPPGVTRVALSVTPNPVWVDERFEVKLTGLAPSQMVTVRGTLMGYGPWQSVATFQADAHGTVDLATQEPRTGSYATADPMGLVWSAVPTDGVAPAYAFPETLTAVPLAITAEVGGEVVAQVSLTRQMLTPAIRQTVILEDGLIGNLYQPVGKEPLPGVLVLGGSEGGLAPYLLEEAALLARHGFVTLALAYFGFGNLPPTLTDIPLEYFGKAIAWLQRQSGVRADRLGVVGTSRGGELALLLGATYPQLKAVVSYVGSGLVFPSLPDGTSSAWTFHGKPLPYVPNAVDADPGIFPKAVIPVERTAGPILLIAAADDQLWPSPLLSEYAFDRLRQFHHPYPDELHIYPNAGHLMGWPYEPTAGDLAYGGTVPGMAAADADAWPRVLHTLGTLRT